MSEATASAPISNPTLTHAPTLTLVTDPSPSVGDLGTYVKQWERELRTDVRRRLKTDKTVRCYMTSVNQYVAYSIENGLPTNVADIERKHVEQFMDWLCENRSPSTASSRFINLKLFFNWLEDEGPENEPLIPDHPMRKMRAPSAGDPPTRRVLSDDVLTALFKACSGPDLASLRDHAILRLFNSAGLRLDELTMLTVNEATTIALMPEDVPFLDLEAGECRVLGKGSGQGKRARIAPFDLDTAIAIGKYLRARERFLRKRNMQDHGRLWISTRTAKPIGINGVSNIVTNAAERAKVGKVHPHLFRHTWTDRMKKLIDKGKISQESVMELGGWKSEQVFRTYGRDNKTQRAVSAYRDIFS